MNFDSKLKNSELPRVIILTAIIKEFKAVTSHLVEHSEYVDQHGHVCEYGEFVGQSQSWNVIVLQTGTGNIEANQVAVKVSLFFQPDLIIFVGIAGSLKADVHLGDVVVSKKVYWYEPGRAEQHALLRRLETVRTAGNLEQRAFAVARREDWRARIKGTCTSPAPNAHVGAIAAGEKLGADLQSQVIIDVKKYCSDALALEMEGYGAMRGAESCDVDSLVIRGISDAIDSKEFTDTQGYQERAAANASAFAFEFLSTLTVKSRHADKLLRPEPQAFAGNSDVEPITGVIPTDGGPSKQWVIKLNGHIDDLEGPKRDLLLNELRTWSGDPELKIDRIEPGSIYVHVISGSIKFEELATTEKPENLPQFVSLQTMAVRSLDEHRHVLKILSSFSKASSGLMRWPTTLGDNQWLSRKELNQLEHILRSQEESATVVLGDPGSGKSALLARLALFCKQAGMPVLGIKADYIDAGIDSLEALRGFLLLPDSVDECVKILSQTGPVVIIIDQLDALADLVDIRSKRLNVLLTLIKRIAKLPNTHLIVSCRTFEYRHDIRLNSIDAETISLSHLDWQQISDILQVNQLNISSWPESSRNILTVPLHLKIFLEVMTGTTELKVLESYQSLFERLWEQRVLTDNEGGERARLLTAMAIDMADKEILWLPSAKFDDHAKVLDGLEASGILSRTEDRKRIGFSHQKLFEYARARAFAQTGESLASYTIDRQDGLFVRSKLWTSLVYLRSADFHSYKAEFSALWDNASLRLHIRHLLIEFLAEVEKPEPNEINWLWDYLINPDFRQKVLVSISGKQGWFEEIQKSHLQNLMKLENKELGGVVLLLVNACQFAQESVLAAVTTSWFPYPEYDDLSFRVLETLHQWDLSSIEMVCTIIARSNIHPFQASIAASRVSHLAPALAPKIVAVTLTRELRRAKDLAESYPSLIGTESENISYRDWECRSAKRRHYTALLENSKDWHDLPEIAAASPKEFIVELWPWFVELLHSAVEESGVRNWRYKDDWSLATSLLGDRDAVVDYPIVTSIEESIRKLAQQYTDDFLALVRRYGQTDIQVVQRLFARGFAELASTHAQASLDFLLTDPRRFALGSHRDSHSDSIALISAISSHLTEPDIAQLEDAIKQWPARHSQTENKDPKSKFEIMKWDRVDRARLLSALPERFLSQETRSFLGEMKRSYENAQKTAGEAEMGSWIGSPMSSNQMSKASDEDILGLFEELVDSTGWDHPRKFMQGGSIPASRAFADFVHTDPERGIRIFSRMSPHRHERPISYALDALVGAGYTAQRLFQVIVSLQERGFKGLEFRTYAASALSKCAKGGEGLSDDICELLEEWLESPWPIEDGDISPAQRKESTPDSIIWGHDRFRSLPQGVYTVLDAIFRGLMLRQPMEADRWLQCLLNHLNRRENIVTWRAVIAFQLPYLVNVSDRKVAIQFLLDLFEKYPSLLNSVDGCVLLAKISNWIPSKTLTTWARTILNSDWDQAPQAFGELLIVGSILLKDEQLSAELEETLSASSAIASVDAIRLGVAHAGAALWGSEKIKAEISKILARLIPLSNSAIGAAILGIFWRTERLFPDEPTMAVLEALRDHPYVLKVGDISHLLGRLQDLALSCPNLVYEICVAILEVRGSEAFDLRTSFGLTSEDMIDIALTLHRNDDPVQRHQGIELFERLLTLNAYGARDALLEIDGRPLNETPSRTLRRRRKRTAHTILRRPPAAR